MSRLKNILSSTKTFIVNRLSSMRTHPFFRRGKRLVPPIDNKTRFWQFIQQATSSKDQWKASANLFQEKLAYLTIEDFRVAPPSGPYQGETVFWMLANATLGGDLPLTVITQLMDKFKNELTVQDLLAHDQEGATFLEFLVNAVYRRSRDKAITGACLTQIVDLLNRVIPTLDSHELNIFLNSSDSLKLLVNICFDDRFESYESTEILKALVGKLLTILEPSHLNEQLEKLSDETNQGDYLCETLFLNQPYQDILFRKILIHCNTHQLKIFFNTSNKWLIESFMKNAMSHQNREKVDLKQLDALLNRIIDEFSNEELLQLFTSIGLSVFLNYVKTFPNNSPLLEKIIGKFSAHQLLWLLAPIPSNEALAIVKKLIPSIQFNDLLYCPQNEMGCVETSLWRLTDLAEAGFYEPSFILDDILVRFGNKISMSIAQLKKTATKYESKSLLWLLSHHLQMHFYRNNEHTMRLIGVLTNLCSTASAEDLQTLPTFPNIPYNNVLTILCHTAQAHPDEMKSLIGRILCNLPLAINPNDLLKDNAALFANPNYRGLLLLLNKRIKVFNALNNLKEKSKHAINTGHDWNKLKQASHALHRAITNSPYDDDGFSSNKQIGSHLAGEGFTEYAASIYEREPESSVHHNHCVRLASELHYALALSAENPALRQHWLSKSLIDARALEQENAIPLIRRIAESYLTHGNKHGLNFNTLPEDLIVKVYRQRTVNAAFKLLDAEGSNFYKNPLLFRPVAPEPAVQPIPAPVEKKYKRPKTIM